MVRLLGDGLEGAGLEMEKTKLVVRGLFLRQMNEEGTDVEGLGFMKVCFHSQN